MRGILEKVLNILNKGVVEYYLYNGVLPSPADYQIDEAADLAKECKLIES